MQHVESVALKAVLALCGMSEESAENHAMACRMVLASYNFPLKAVLALCGKWTHGYWHGEQHAGGKWTHGCWHGAPGSTQTGSAVPRPPAHAMLEMLLDSTE